MKITVEIEPSDWEEIRSQPHWSNDAALSNAAHEALAVMFHGALESVMDDDYATNPIFAAFVDEYWRIHEAAPLELLAEQAE
jgi:hypothetical protein